MSELEDSELRKDGDLLNIGVEDSFDIEDWVEDAEFSDEGLNEDDTNFYLEDEEDTQYTDENSEENFIDYSVKY
jgi:hypothetical protein